MTVAANAEDSALIEEGGFACEDIMSRVIINP